MLRGEGVGHRDSGQVYVCRVTQAKGSCIGAQVQDAAAGSGEQAAHVLAGQILIDGSPPWILSRGLMKIAWLARFMVTSAVPVSFNVADSAAEKAGLTEAFRHGCEQAWVRAAAGQRDLLSTYEEFLEDADRAFQRARYNGARTLEQTELRANPLIEPNHASETQEVVAA